MIARYTKSYSLTSALSIQAYFDRTYRHVTRDHFIDELFTYDIDLQHNFAIGRRNKIVWGLGYRIADNRMSGPANFFDPANRTLQLYSGFIQDEFSIIPEKLEFTLGTKVLHNDFTGIELHPTARLAWIPNMKHTIWAAVSQGVRTPSRLETDYRNPGLGAYGEFDSEKVIAYEFGYRIQPRENISVSLSTYYNDYRDLRSIDTNYDAPPAFYFGNNLEATTYGAELSAKIIATKWWKIRGGYSYIEEDFNVTSPRTYPLTSSFEAIDPKNHFLIQSLMDLGKHFQFDVTARYVDLVPAAINIPSVESYFTFDVRIAWHYKWITWAVVGQNLADKSHGSSGTIEIPRSGFTRLIVRF